MKIGRSPVSEYGELVTSAVMVIVRPSTGRADTSGNHITLCVIAYVRRIGYHQFIACFSGIPLVAIPQPCFSKQYRAREPPRLYTMSRFSLNGMEEGALEVG